MAFGKKKTEFKYDQSQVSMLATKALQARREQVVRLAVRIVGDTPLLMHRWSQKAIMEMVGKMVGQPQPRLAKDLTEEYEAAGYRNEKGEVAIPCRIVKASIVNGAIATAGVVTKADLKRSLRVLGYTSPIVTKRGQEVRPDYQIADNNGSKDMRARALVPAGYYFDVVLQFSPSILTPDQVIAALEGAGSAIGLCDWRLEKGGDYGAFHVEVRPDTEQDAILARCDSPEEVYKIPPQFLRALKGTLDSDAARKMAAVVEKTASDSRGRRAKNGAVAS